MKGSAFCLVWFGSVRFSGKAKATNWAWRCYRSSSFLLFFLPFFVVIFQPEQYFHIPVEYFYSISDG